MSRQVEISAEDTKPKGFDLTVTHRDPQTGQIIKEDPYVLRVVGVEGGGKMSIFERPKGSGNCYDKQNNPIGRWVGDKLDKDAAHVAYVAPLTGDQRVRHEMNQDKAKIAELKSELDAIRAESAKKAPAPTKKDQGA